MSKAIGHFDREFELSGGILCLDFANTVEKRKIPGRTRENLAEFSDLVMFAKQSRVVSPQYARELLAGGLVKPREAAQVLRAAVILREAIYRVFAAVANAQMVSHKDLNLIEEFAAEAMKHRQLVAAAGQFRWEWKRHDGDDLRFVVWPMAQSAAELLTSERIQRVRECAAPTCAWLFLDESRNRSRRWCDMTVCGNRQKARRHYERQHA